MDAETIDKVLSLSQPIIKKFDERNYSDRKLEPIMEPRDVGEEVTTLTGLIDLMKAKINGIDWVKCYVQVESPKMVTVSELECDKWGRRQVHIVCNLPSYGAFRFGEYLGQEAFIIGLNAFFDRENSTDFNEIVTMAAKLKAEAVSEAEDNGIAQSVTLRKGPVMAEKATVKKIVKLRPYRTFREIAQPESDFIFRLRTQQGETPSLALFVADAEMWQAKAMQDIKGYLAESLAGVEIIA